MTRRFSRSARPGAAVWSLLFVALAIGPTFLLASQAPPTPTIKSVRITQSGDLWTILFEADGALTVPTIGELDRPPRVYMDFEGVRTTVNRVTAEPGSPIVRVRAAINSNAPLVTRVVVDLAFKQPVRTETEQLESGRFKVLIGTVAPAPETSPVHSEAAVSPDRLMLPPVDMPTPVSAPATAPRPASPPAEAAAPPVGTVTASVPSSIPDTPGTPPGLTPVPARSTTPPIPAKDAERYLEQVAGTLEPYRKLQPALVSIDRQEPAPPAGLGSIREELARLLRTLVAFRPSDNVKPVHDVLTRSVSFALMAATLRQDAGTRGDPVALRNAASAAAGALLLLDRACVELSCPPLSGSK